MSKLLNKTHELLVAEKRPMEQIAVHTGLGYGWLVRFKGGYSPNQKPAVDKVETLYEFLSGKELQV